MAITTVSDVASAARANGYAMSLSLGTLAVGDVVVLGVQSEDNVAADRPGAPAVPAGGLPLAVQQTSTSLTNKTTTVMYAGTVSALGAKTINIADPSSSGNIQWSAVARVYPATDGYFLAGTPANVGATAATTCVNATSGTPSGTLTTVGANSEIFAIAGDWSAVDPSTVAYATGFASVGSGAPSFLSGRSTQYWFAKTCGAAGAQTVGLTAPTGQNWALCGIEIQLAATGVRLRPPLVVRQAVNRAATF